MTYVHPTDPPSLGETVAGILGTFTVPTVGEDDGGLLCYACRPPASVAIIGRDCSDGLDGVVLAALEHARTVHPPIRHT